MQLFFFDLRYDFLSVNMAFKVPVMMLLGVVTSRGSNSQSQ